MWGAAARAGRCGRRPAGPFTTRGGRRRKSQGSVALGRSVGLAGWLQPEESVEERGLAVIVAVVAVFGGGEFDSVVFGEQGGVGGEQLPGAGESEVVPGAGRGDRYAGWQRGGHREVARVGAQISGWTTSYVRR